MDKIIAKNRIRKKASLLYRMNINKEENGKGSNAKIRNSSAHFALSTFIESRNQ